MSDQMEYRAVLDASAMLSYARGHVHVGELIIDITEDEEAVVGLPAVALLSAFTSTLGNEPATGRLQVLASLPTVWLMPLGIPQAVEISTFVPAVSGDLALAHAVWAAVEYDTYYLTTEPQRVPSIVHDDKIITMPKDDA